MSSLRDFEDGLRQLSSAEKAQVLKWLVQDLGDAFRGIESHPGVCGGEPCIVRTRIPVWLLEKATRGGPAEHMARDAAETAPDPPIVNSLRKWRRNGQLDPTSPYLAYVAKSLLLMIWRRGRDSNSRNP